MGAILLFCLLLLAADVSLELSLYESRAGPFSSCLIELTNYSERRCTCHNSIKHSSNTVYRITLWNPLLGDLETFKKN